MGTKVCRRRMLTSSIAKLEEDDLIVEILKRLPDPGTSFRCKSVCKHWNSIISTPYFSRRFLSHHQIQISSAAAEESESPVLTVSDIRESILSFLPFPPELQSQFSVLESIKDLLLIGFLARETDDELDRTYLVCNPVTRQWVALPLRPKNSTRRGWSGPAIVKLVCEPRDSPGLDLGHGQVFNCHLGYRRFRVVRMFDFESPSWQVEVFCSTSVGWTKLFLRPHAGLRRRHSDRLVSANAKLYWLNQRAGAVVWDPFCYDRPPTLVGGCDELKGCCLAGPWVSDGALHMISREFRSSAGLSVWRLEEGKGGGWRKQYGVMSLKNVSCNGMILDGCKTEALEWEFQGVFGLHPDKSEIVFLTGFFPFCRRSATLSWNFRKEELEFLSYQDVELQSLPYQLEQLFQPCVTFWPSPIPGHAKLRNTYKGSYNCWLSPGNRSSSGVQVKANHLFSGLRNTCKGSYNAWLSPSTESSSGVQVKSQQAL